MPYCFKLKNITMRAPTPVNFFLIAVLAAIHPIWGISQYTAVDAASSWEEGPLRLEGIHQATNCLKQEEVVPPIVYAPDNVITYLTYQDQYFRLGCAVSGFTEYFAPSRWAALKINGDGGVDVTGAPNSILVEGANRASVIATPRSAASYRIAIPAEGYVSFDWGYIGGSNLLNQQFWIEVNGVRAESMAEGHTAGSFFSNQLFSGDILSFNIVSEDKGFEIQLSNFEFFSNAIGVIERQWEAGAKNGQQGHFTQWVSVKKPDFTQVIFPGNCDGISYPLIESGASIEPEWTGYPVIDEDGSIATTHDQYPLTDDGCAFSLKWEDEVLPDNGNCIVFRHWIISDYCGDNVQDYTQVIKMRGSCPEGSSPLPYGQFDIPENGNQNGAGDPKYSVSNGSLQAALNSNPVEAQLVSPAE